VTTMAGGCVTQLTDRVWFWSVKCCCSVYSERNLKFYRNELPMPVYDKTIEEILSDWPEQFDILEGDLVYINWLFPSPTTTTGLYQQALTTHEAKELRTDLLLRSRLYRSLSLVLSMFGLTLSVEGEFGLADNFESRLHVFQSQPHTITTVTHLLCSLPHLGFETVSQGFAQFLARLIYRDKTWAGLSREFERLWWPLLDRNTQTHITHTYGVCV
ncbi:opioid growth factor receptor-like protein 1, partial [Argonauta hians]